jgi:hypothetical protein
MKRLIPLILFGLFAIQSCKEVTPEVLDSEANIRFILKTGTERVHKVISRKEGGFVFVGQNSQDAFILVMDQTGREIAYNTWGGDQKDVFTNVIQAQNGDLIACGFSRSTQYTDSAVRSNAVVVRFNANAGKIWDAAFGGSFEDQFYALCEGPDGSIYAGGFVETTRSSGTTQNYFVKLTSNGAMVSERSFYNRSKLGNSHIMSMHIGQNGNVICYGYQTEIFSFSTYDKYILFRQELSAVNGLKAATVDYYENYFRIDGVKDLIYHGIHVVRVGNVDVMSNLLNSPTGGIQVLLTAVNDQGDTTWSKSIKNQNMWLGNVCTDNENNMYMLGGEGDLENNALLGGEGEISSLTNVRHAKAVIYKLDQNGNQIWKKSIGSELAIQWALNTYLSNNEIYVAGLVDDLRIGKSKFMFFKLNSNGDFEK